MHIGRYWWRRLGWELPLSAVETQAVSFGCDEDSLNLTVPEDSIWMLDLARLTPSWAPFTN